MTLLAGDVVEVDFGSPVGSEPGFLRPAVVVSADAYLAMAPRTLHVVPCTSTTTRRFQAEVPVEAEGLTAPTVAQCHLLDVISVERLTGRNFGRVAARDLFAVRSVLGDLLDLG